MWVAPACPCRQHRAVAASCWRFEKTRHTRTPEVEGGGVELEVDAAVGPRGRVVEALTEERDAGALARSEARYGPGRDAGLGLDLGAGASRRRVLRNRARPDQGSEGGGRPLRLRVQRSTTAG